MTTVSVNELTYEELVLLQEIMISLSDHSIFMEMDYNLLSSLHQKIMES
jgi:hypothetical protein